LFYRTTTAPMVAPITPTARPHTPLIPRTRDEPADLAVTAPEAAADDLLAAAPAEDDALAVEATAEELAVVAEAPVAVGWPEKSEAEAKVVQDDEAGIRATYGMEEIGPRDSGGWT